MNYRLASELSFVAAAVLHELGHVVVARFNGVKVKKFGLTWFGPYNMREMGTRSQNLRITLAGPATNLLLFIAAILRFPLLVDLPFFATANLLLALVNFSPWPKFSDGARIVRILRG